MSRPIYRVFVSSPGDVGEERRSAVRVLERLHGKFGAVIDIAPILWEHEPVRATSSFQHQITPPAECEVVVCILWSRLGTRLPDDFRRPDGTPYESGTAFELESGTHAFQRHGRPDLLVYRKTATPLFDISDRAHRGSAVQQWDDLVDYLERWFRNPNGSFKAGFTQFERPDEFEALLSEHVERLVGEWLVSRDIAAGAERLAAPVWLEGSPYRGLEVFDLRHASIFHGRGRAISEVKDRLVRQAAAGAAFLLVYGMSGSGKSSLVRAGLLPTILEPGVIEGVGLWRHVVMRPSDGRDPLHALVQGLLTETALPELVDGDFVTSELPALFRDDPTRAIAPVRGALERASAAIQQEERLAGAPRAMLALVVDQLDELFTLEGLETEQRRQFVDALAALARSGLVWVVCTIRSDLYHRCAEVPTLTELKDGLGSYELLPPRGSEIAQMIRNPAAAAGVRFEEVDPGGWLNDVLQEEAAKDPESLPLLEFLLDALYQRRDPEGRLTFDAYRRLGGLEGAIAKRAGEVLERLPSTAAHELPSMVRALVSMSTGADKPMARWAETDVLRATAARSDLVDAFLAARLLVSDGDTEAGAVRVTHEALLQRWPLAARIVNQNREFFLVRERVQADAALWRSEARDPGLLLAAGKRLSEATELLSHRHEDLDADLREYIEASVSAEESRRRAQERSARRRRHAATAALVVFATLAGAASLMWMRAERESERADTRTDEARVAEQQARDSARAATADAIASAREARARQSAQLGVLSGTELPRDPGLALLLALEAGHVTTREDEPLTVAGDRALREALAGSGGQLLVAPERTLGLGDEPSVVLGPDERWLVTFGRFVEGNGWVLRLRLWDLEQEPVESSVLADARPPVAFGPGGRWLFTGAADGVFLAWDLRRSDPAESARRVKASDERVGALAISLDARWLATAAPLRLWDLSSDAPFDQPVSLSAAECEPEPPQVYAGMPRPLLAASPDSRWLLAGGYYDDVARTAPPPYPPCLWDLGAPSSESRPTVLTGHERSVTNVMFSHDGRRLATHSREGGSRSYAPQDMTVRVWNLEARDLSDRPWEIVQPGLDLDAVVLAPDGLWLLTGGDEGPRLWDLNGRPGRRPARLEQGLEGRPVAIGPPRRNERWFVTAGEEAILWKLESDGSGRSSIERQPAALRGVSTASASADQRWVAIGRQSGAAELWSLRADEPLTQRRRFTAGPGGVEDIVLSGRSMAVVQRNAVRLWSLARDQGSADPVVLRTASTLIVGGRWLAGAFNGQLRVWDLRAPTVSQPVRVGTGRGVKPLALSPNGHWLVSWDFDDQLRLWNVQDPSHAPEMLWSPESVDDPERPSFYPQPETVFGPDARWLATGLPDGSVAVRNLTTSRSVVGTPHQDRVRRVEASTDGRWLVTTDSTDRACVWELGADALPATPVCREGVSGLRVGGAGRWLAAPVAGGVSLWRLTSGDPWSSPLVLHSGLDELRQVIIDPQGRWLAAYGNDESAELWRLETDPVSPVPEQLEFPRSFRTLGYSRDGRWITATGGSWSRTLAAWDLASAVASRELFSLPESDLDIWENVIALMSLDRGDDMLATWWSEPNWGESAGFVEPVSFLSDNAFGWDRSAGGRQVGYARLALRTKPYAGGAKSVSGDGRWFISVEDTTTSLWRLRRTELERLACQTAGRNLTRGEWARYFADRDYERTCPGWPAPGPQE